ncbi:MAG: hypothetical protein M3O50_14795 [Myxococcota bacterium]|nr:hypothetical protein [Myxococcota bacterium]
MRTAPQPSPTVPHVAPCAAHVVFAQPHLFGTPPPPQLAGGAQLPQSIVPPHPSEPLPQSKPSVPHVALGTQRPLLAVPLLAGLPVLAVPLLAGLPELAVPPLLAVPLLAVLPLLVGVPPPQWNAATPPPPHVAGAVHWPHASWPPHPSGGAPQFAPSVAHVAGRQPQWFGAPAPPHVSGPWQLPQSTTLLQPSEIRPHVAFACWHVVGVHAPDPHRFGPAPPQS